MFRSFTPFLAPVRFSQLFEHNHVLKRVFDAPTSKIALTLELPGIPETEITYGQLQRDVVAMADSLVQRKEAIAKSRGEPSLGWLQASKPSEVRSVFAQGERTPSCDYMKDTGSYTTALMCGPGYTYVVSMLASWSINQLTTPMSVSQKYSDELMYVLEHSGARTIIGQTALLKDKFPEDYSEFVCRHTKEMPIVSAKAKAASSPAEDNKTYMVDTVVDSQDLLQDFAMSKLMPKEPLTFDTDHLELINPVFRHWHKNPASRPTRYDDCLMIYTSGTTARPKGAVHTHASVSNMVTTLQTAWKWSEKDAILHVLPVHHVHGLVNILFCSLASHARCVFTKFDDAGRIVNRLQKGDLTLFMAVPTIYTKLIASLSKKFSQEDKDAFKASCVSNIRLMVSGSAALPVPTLQQFKELSGHTLLERYGMTEIGMALSQPLEPIEDRLPGTVGSPLPTVEAYVHKPETAEAAEQTEAGKEQQYDAVGGLSIASESLFDRYWNNPTATKKELRTDEAGKRYFDTGDTVGVMQPGGKAAVYTILGRSSVDIIKCRGYKLSALEIEAALLSRKDLFYETAVVGVADQERGEMVVAVVALQPDAVTARGIAFSPHTKSFESAELNAELKKVALDVLASYKAPTRFIVVPEIPRNPTGKVNKKDLKKAVGL